MSVKRKTKKSLIRRRKKQSTTSKKIITIIVFVLLFAGIAGGVWLYIRSSHQTQQSTDANYFVDSKYKDITSHVKKHTSKRISSFLEYPVTKNKKINKTIATVIDTWHEDFMVGIKDRQPADGSTFVENVSFDVPSAPKGYLSIVLNGKYDEQGAHPYAMQSFWTFDMEAGKEVTLRDLVDDSEDGMDFLTKKIRSAAAKEVDHNDALFEDEMTAEKITHFIVKDATTMTFSFPPATIAPSSAGEIRFDVAIDKSFAKSMNNDTARALFDVPKPPAPKPKPKPKPAPAPDPAPPRADTSNGNCPAGQRCVALTFDDGPGPYTDELLDTLKRHNAKASFFTIGPQVNARAGVVAREAREGHAVGNHTWNHPDLTTVPRATITQELSSTNAAIKKATGQQPTMLREPYGAINNTVSAVAKEQGLSSILWSVDTRDWADRDSSIVCNRAVANAYSGAIILMHDIHPTTVNAVPCILDGLKKQGFTMVTVPQLLGELTPGATYFQAKG